MEEKEAVVREGGARVVAVMEAARAGEVVAEMVEEAAEAAVMGAAGMVGEAEEVGETEAAEMEEEAEEVGVMRVAGMVVAELVISVEMVATAAAP